MGIRFPYKSKTEIQEAFYLTRKDPTTMKCKCGHMNSDGAAVCAVCDTLLIEPSCENATPQELFEMGLQYYRAADYAQAVIFLHKAAELGNTDARKQLAHCYQKGQGVEKAPEKALYWAGKGSPPYNLILSYSSFFYKNVKEVAEYYRLAVDEGDAEAQRNLAHTYEHGHNGQQNYAAAIYWYQKAAEQGYAVAQNDLALCYENGCGVTKDHEKALYWYRKAADLGNADAQTSLALFYAEAQDYESAVHWYQKAAEQGNAVAQRQLAICYATGQVVPQDYDQAVYWYEKAIPQEPKYLLDQYYDDAKSNAKTKTSWFYVESTEHEIRREYYSKGKYERFLEVASRFVICDSWSYEVDAEDYEERNRNEDGVNYYKIDSSSLLIRDGQAVGIVLRKRFDDAESRYALSEYQTEIIYFNAPDKGARFSYSVSSPTADYYGSDYITLVPVSELTEHDQVQEANKFDFRGRTSVI